MAARCTTRTPAATPPSLDDQLCFALYSTGRAFNRLYREALPAPGPACTRYPVMLVLRRRDDRTVSQTGERPCLGWAMLTPLLKRMEQARLLRRERSREGERRVVASPSAAGPRLAGRAAELPGLMPGVAGCSFEHSCDLRSARTALRMRLLAPDHGEPAA